MKILGSEEGKVRRKNDARYTGRKNMNDVVMRENRKRHDILNKNSVSFTAVTADDPAYGDDKGAVKDVDGTGIRGMKSPIMMGTGVTSDGR